MGEILIAISNWVEQWQFIIKLAALLTAVGLLWKYVLKPIKDFAIETKNFFQEINRAYPILDQISKDFKPNGGNSIRDVVDRIERNQFLSEEKYKAIIEFQDIGMFETDKEGKYTWVSPKWIEITGMSELEASNNGWIVGVSSNNRDKVWYEWEKAIEQTRQFGMRYEIHTGDLSGNKNIYSIAIPTKGKNGELSGYIGKIAIDKRVEIFKSGDNS